MDAKSSKEPSPSFRQTVEEITKLYKSLPPRPSYEDVQAAMSVIKTVNAEEQLQIEEIAKQEVPEDVPGEIFSVLQEMKKNMVLLHSHEQKKHAFQLIELDKIFQSFDELAQKASALVSGEKGNEKERKFYEKIDKEDMIKDENLVNKKKSEEIVIKDESLLKKKKGPEGLVKSSSSRATFSSECPVSIDDRDTEKMGLMKVTAVIENSAKTKATTLDLRGRLMDQIEWLPLSIGKLSDVAEMDLSENQIMALPSTFGSLKALTKLDIHSNELINLPDSFGELVNLTNLDLYGNRLRSLPASFGKLINLINLDLSSNQIAVLPETFGNLASLETLNVETNELEELPYTIGGCLSLVELRLDFNQLKALPEAIGKLEYLEILTLHYNRIQGLPTTIGNLSNLRELDVSFNELETIPENLCFATRLQKLNLGNNFADLRALPRSIGNLEMLEELDISNDQIRVLPDSFRFLSNLRVLRADETPLEEPPRHIAKLGAQAVVQYLAELVEEREHRPKLSRREGCCSWIFLLFRPKSRRTNNMRA